MTYFNFSGDVQTDFTAMVEQLAVGDTPRGRHDKGKIGHYSLSGAVGLVPVDGLEAEVIERDDERNIPSSHSLQLQYKGNEEKSIQLHADGISIYSVGDEELFRGAEAEDYAHLIIQGLNDILTADPSRLQLLPTTE